MSRRSRERRHNCRFGGKKGWWKGKKNEEKFYCSFCLESFEKPSWLKKVRYGTPDEDNQGIDFVVETYSSPPFIFIQIKSSEAGKRKFWKQHSPESFNFPIIVLVLNKHIRHNNIRRMLFETIKIRIGLY